MAPAEQLAEQPERQRQVSWESVKLNLDLQGTAFALNLKKVHGIPCTIYERNEGVDPEGVNIALAPNAVSVLQHIGVYHTLRAQGCTYERLAVSNSRGQEIGSLAHGSERY